MNKRGFTLIELLAVIVILAIIALIATPIVLSIISDSKESASLRSAEMYLDSVEYGIADVILDNKTIQNGTHTIMENGDICIGTYNDKKCTGDIIEVEVNGETPKEGSTVTIEEGKIKDINLLYGDKTIIKDSKGNLVYGELGVEEEETLAPGLYDAEGNMTYSWSELISDDLSIVGTGLEGCTYSNGILVIDNSITNITNENDSLPHLSFQSLTVVIPSSVTDIASGAFDENTIYYSGTAVNDGNNWGASEVKPYSEAVELGLVQE